MKKFYISLLVCNMFALLFAQGNTAETDKQVLMWIDNEPVYSAEFLYIFDKNNNDNAAQKVSLDEYLELFTNFKLKVAEAKSEQLDTTAKFAEELKGYRAQVIDKYLRDDNAIDSLVRLSYYRMGHIRRASHIVIQCPKDANDSTRAAARAQIESLRRRVVQGKEDFYELAMHYSDDPNKDKLGAELGWILPFRYIYSFEDAVYNTPVGEITRVFESPFGLHIALVEEEIETEEVHAAHIMKMVSKKDASKDNIAKQTMDSIHRLLLAGADFKQMAINNSDDRGSSARGGDLGYFTRGTMVKPFEDAAFALKTGEMSQPFRSDYGWHVITVYDRRHILPLDSMYDQVKKNVERDERIGEAQKRFIANTRIEYNLPDLMTDEEVMAYADAHLEEKHEDLRNLVREYHDGILLFDISLDRVWDKASKDTEGLKQYFNEHKKEYKWDDKRFKGFIIYAKDNSAAKRAEAIIKTVHPDSIQSVIRQRINNDSTQFVRVEKGLWKKGQSMVIDKYVFRMKNVNYEPSEEFPVLRTIGKTLSNPEEYTDERGKVVTDYQDQLEKEWLKELRTKHTVRLNDEAWQAIKANR